MKLEELDLLELDEEYENPKVRKGHHALVRKSKRHDDRRKKNRAQEKRAWKKELRDS